MSQHKKQQIKDRRTSTRKRTTTTYTLELLESRVLLSADLAGVVQAVPIQPAQAPSQAVTLNAPAGTNAAQQTFSVSEMLATPASSFPQYAGEPDQAIANEATQAPGLSRELETQIIPNQQDGATSQAVTPTDPISGMRTPVVSIEQLPLVSRLQTQPLQQTTTASDVAARSSFHGADHPGLTDCRSTIARPDHLAISCHAHSDIALACKACANRHKIAKHYSVDDIYYSNFTRADRTSFSTYHYDHIE